jgi:hypothetical protein
MAAKRCFEMAGSSLSLIFRLNENLMQKGNYIKLQLAQNGY